jgi:nicotinate-nucleotide pyrophosphorylase (carboxylating)
MGLFDAALVKDNHVAAAGGVVRAFTAVRRHWPDLPVQVEVDSLGQLDEVLDAGATEVLLDNFSLEELRAAVALNRGRAALEASGGLTLSSAAAVAATGVDSVAVGALTHSVAVLDIGADYRQEA